MLTLHHLSNSRSQRILWLLEELELDYRIEHYTRRGRSQRAPESLKNIHPLGKSPVLTTGDLVFAESGAIIEYLIETHAPGWIPERGSRDYHQYKYWRHYAEGSLMPYFIMKRVFDKIKQAPMPLFIKLVFNKVKESPLPPLFRPMVQPLVDAIHSKVMKKFLAPNITNNLNFIETHLSQNEWFAGPVISGADIQMSYSLETGRKRLHSHYPHIQAFLQRIHERPAYQKALQAGENNAYAEQKRTVLS